MFGGDSDLDTMIRDTGVPVTYTSVAGVSQQVYGIVDQRDVEMFSEDAAGFAGRVITVKVSASALPGAAEGATVAFGGATYRVTQVRMLDDGALLDLYCSA